MTEGKVKNSQRNCIKDIAMTMRIKLKKHNINVEYCDWKDIYLTKKDFELDSHDKLIAQTFKHSL